MINTNKAILRKQLTRIILMMMFALISFACGTTQLLDSTSANSRTYPVEKQYKKLYRALGGEKVLGPAISPDTSIEGKSCQYLANALVCENSDGSGIHLEPIGRKLNIYEEPKFNTDVSNSYMVNGYQIHPEFIKLYTDLKPEMAGLPITNAIYNIEMNRTEQYFENVGFYIADNSTQDKAALIPYGAMECGHGCMYFHAFTLSSHDEEDPFETALRQYGGASIFGTPLTKPYEASDGMIEQVFDKVVVFAPPENLQAIRLRPIPGMLGFNPDPPVEQRLEVENNFVFYATDGLLGYHVPRAFDTFIHNHGIRDLSGNPIFEPKLPDDEIGQLFQYQCFENQCIEYRPGETSQIQLIALGQKYLEIANPGTYSITAEDLFVECYPEHRQVSAGTNQRIYLKLQSLERQEPVPNVRVKLTITSPSGTELQYDMPNTNSEGQSFTSIEPATADAKHSDMMRYEVCLFHAEKPLKCEYGSYLIWNLDI